MLSSQQNKVQCTFFTQSRCRYGDECRFAHGEKLGTTPRASPLNPPLAQSFVPYSSSSLCFVPMPVNQVYVGRLFDTHRSRSVTDAYLRGYFGVFGKVLSAFVVIDASGGDMGFVSFADARDMEVALEVEHSILDEEVPVKRANPCRRLPKGYGEREFSESNIKDMELGAEEGRRELAKMMHVEFSDESCYYDMQYSCSGEEDKERYKNGDPVTQVLVRGLPAAATDLYLEGYFGVFGVVRYIVSKQGGKEGGAQAYISFSPDDDIEAILRIHHKVHDTEVTLQTVAVPAKKGKGKRPKKTAQWQKEIAEGKKDATLILQDARLRAGLGLNISQEKTNMGEFVDVDIKIGWHEALLEADRGALGQEERNKPRLIQTLPKADVILDKERRSLRTYLEHSDALPVPAVLKQIVISCVPENMGVCISCSKVHAHVRKHRCCVCADCDAELAFICAGCNEGECAKHKERERVQCMSCESAFHWRCRHYLEDNIRCPACVDAYDSEGHDYSDLDAFNEYMHDEYMHEAAAMQFDDEDFFYNPFDH